MKALLLENIHKLAVDELKSAKIEVEAFDRALTEDELIEKVKDVDFLGIRSKTTITKKVIDRAPKLLAVGCFCIGTNQVATEYANEKGIVVYNAPFSNTRSVAEMMISEIVMLSRQLGDRNSEMHRGVWNKTSSGCFEIRGKTLGIIGYGNIGTQVSMMAEALGMRVMFYDVISKLSLGNAKPSFSMNALLEESDFVVLHVPATPQTHRMMGEREIAKMKKGAYLINASRGTVVDIDALAAALKTKHLAGAAIDVFPKEPEKNGPGFETPLAGLSNVVLTPHIGGATEEAQANIGREVADRLIAFMEKGSTSGSVNFPIVDLPFNPKNHRVVNVHKNVPGVLKEINRIVSEFGANIEAQGLATDPNVGYLVMDLNQSVALDVKNAIEALPTSIKTRILT